jgi:hypothetical protein
LNALLLALALFSGTVSASPTVHLTNDSPTVSTIAAPVTVRPAAAKAANVPAKIALPAPKAVTPVPKAPAPKPTKPVTAPACDEEDDTVTSAGKDVASCYWDATKRGNGKGKSFTKTATPTGTIFKY